MRLLGQRVQRRPDGAVARICPRSPGAGEDLVGPPAEQERIGALVDLVHDRRGFVVKVRPSAALESAALVLLRPAGPLHHSVNGDLRGGRQLHGRSSSLAGFCRRSVGPGLQPFLTESSSRIASIWPTACVSPSSVPMEASCSMASTLGNSLTIDIRVLPPPISGMVPRAVVIGSSVFGAPPSLAKPSRNTSRCG